MNFIKILMRNLALGPSTDPFPFGETFTPEGYHGRVAFNAHNCTACRTCEQVCAGQAIRLEKSADGLRFTLYHNTCTFCGLCAFYCPSHAITLTDDWHLSHTEDQKFEMKEQGLIPQITCSNCGAKMLATAPTPALLGDNPTPEAFDRLQHLCPACRRKAAASRAQPNRGQS